MDDPGRMYRLAEVKGGKYKLSDLQWALGQFEQRYGYVPTVYLRNPATTLDGPFDGLFEDDERLAVGLVLLGPVREG